MRLIQLAFGALTSLALAATPPAGPGLLGAVWVGARHERNAVIWVFHNVFSFRDGQRFDLGMYPVGALIRVEGTNYDTVPQFAMHARRETAGARVRIAGGLSAHVHVVHQTSQVAHGHPLAMDVGLTYSVRH
jgi:hypothetical protein